MGWRTATSNRTVFALAGGGNLGAVQVGMLHALLEAGVRPDAVVGTSIGALNGAFLAGHADLAGVEELAELWMTVTRRDVFHLNLPGLVRGIFGHRQFLFEPLGVRKLIVRARLGFSDLEDAPIPLRVVATDLATSDVMVLSQGSVVDALLASSAIPGLFPPVDVNGRLLVDGGVVANTPLSEANALGASTIHVLPTLPENIPVLGSNALVMMQRGMAMASRPATRHALEAVNANTAVHVMPVPAVAGQLSIFDFSQTRRLIDEAYEMGTEWLDRTRLLEPEADYDGVVA
jgi:NTE family protein